MSVYNEINVKYSKRYLSKYSKISYVLIDIIIEFIEIKIKVGDTVDIKDDHGIWCVGNICVINSHTITVKYIGWNILAMPEFSSKRIQYFGFEICPGSTRPGYSPTFGHE